MFSGSVASRKYDIDFTDSNAGVAGLFREEANQMTKKWSVLWSVKQCESRRPVHKVMAT